MLPDAAVLSDAVFDDWSDALPAEEAPDAIRYMVYVLRASEEIVVMTIPPFLKMWSLQQILPIKYIGEIRPGDKFFSAGRVQSIIISTIYL